MLPLILLCLSSCAQTAVRTEAVTVKVPSYVALPSALIDPEPMPPFPDILTNGSLASYTLALQTALKIDIDKIQKIGALQPKP